jgi:hypothetical protein
VTSPSSPQHQSAGNGTSVRNWKHRTEADLASAALVELDPYFTADREVWGTHCSGKRLRLDAVLRPRDPTGWADPPPAFGVEFKNAYAGSFDTRHFTTWAAQAVDYAHTQWDGYGPLTIFACPAISAAFAADRTASALAAARLMVRVLGQLGVGELGETGYGWTLRLNGDNIWSERYGVHRKWSLDRKVGSR